MEGLLKERRHSENSKIVHTKSQKSGSDLHPEDIAQESQGEWPFRDGAQILDFFGKNSLLENFRPPPPGPSIQGGITLVWASPSNVRKKSFGKLKKKYSKNYIETTAQWL